MIDVTFGLDRTGGSKCFSSGGESRIVMERGLLKVFVTHDMESGTFWGKLALDHPKSTAYSFKIFCLNAGCFDLL